MAPPGLNDAPPPWVLEAEVYMFLGWSSTPQLPSGSFHPQEKAAISAEEHSILARTPYAIQLFRYKSSPVGPYDELMFLPGFYKTAVRDPTTGKPSYDHSPRITRIYVSTAASIFNGRTNWNIPKHKADFSFEYQPSGEIKIQVSLPGQAASPFFGATVTPSKTLPSFKFNTDWLPIKLDVLQPPLPVIRGDGDDESNSPDTEVVGAGTTRWQKTPLRIIQKDAQIAYIKPLLDGGKNYANGVDFPNIAPLSSGVFSKHAIIDFLEPVTPNVIKLAEVGSNRVKQD